MSWTVLPITSGRALLGALLIGSCLPASIAIREIAETERTLEWLIIERLWQQQSYRHFRC
jgi:hypothetical protein